MPTPYTPELLTQIIQMYAGGLTATEIGRKLRLDRNTVCKRLKENGVDLRMGKGSATRRFSPEEEADVVTLYQRGWGIAAIADHVQCGKTLVRNTLARQNVPLRPKENAVLDKELRAKLTTASLADPLDERICSRCKVSKPLGEFYAHPQGRGGYRAECKLCSAAYPSQRSQVVMDRTNAIRMRNRQFVWDYYATHPCIDCGEADPIVLEADHRDSTTKLGGLATLAHGGRSLKVIQDELAKCDVVCANCHRRRTAKTQGWYSGIQIASAA